MIQRAIPLLLLATPLAAQSSSTPIPGTGWSVEILYISTPGHPKSVHPEIGVPFSTGSFLGNTFGPPTASSDGSHWIVKALVDTGSADDNSVYLRDDRLMIREGTQAPWSALGHLVGQLPDRVAINNAGAVVFTNNLGGTAPNSADDCVVLYAGGGYTLIAKEGMSAAALVPALAGATWDDEMTTASLNDAGAIGFRADGIDGTPGGGLTDEVLIFDGSVYLQETTDGPSGLAGGALDLWQDFEEDSWFGADGATTLVRGYTNGPPAGDQVIALGNHAVLQEGQRIPGGPFAQAIGGNAIFRAELDRSGTWFARGHLTDLRDWVVRDGVVVAFSGGANEVVAGTGEHWSDFGYFHCFFLQTGNAAGAFLIGGETDASLQKNGVIVYDDGAGDRSIALRENDPIDLDGDGVFADDRFFHTFGNDEALLLDDGSFLISTTVRDGTGILVDEGLFRILPCGWSTYGVGASAANVLELSGGGSAQIGGVFQAIASNVTGAFTVTGISLGAASLPLLGGVALIDPTALVTTAVTTPTGGVSTQSVPIPSDPSIAGLGVYLQAIADDATQPQGFALSNGLKLVLCE